MCKGHILHCLQQLFSLWFPEGLPKVNLYLLGCSRPEDVGSEDLWGPQGLIDRSEQEASLLESEEVEMRILQQCQEGLKVDPPAGILHKGLNVKTGTSMTMEGSIEGLHTIAELSISTPQSLFTFCVFVGKGKDLFLSRRARFLLYQNAGKRGVALGNRKPLKLSIFPPSENEVQSH